MPSRPLKSGRQSFVAFLSHKYNAPLVNEYFFRLFSDIAEVQFDVDAGKTSTNVTRLERMIRNADAFIGLYPFEPVDLTNPSPEELQKASQYFRLELDLATRARKPGLIFVDSRFLSALSVPASIIREEFNIQEIVAAGAKPSSDAFAQRFAQFCGRVAANRDFKLSEHAFDKTTYQVGILVPTGTSDGYESQHIDCIRTSASKSGFQPIVMNWPPVLTPEWMGQVRTFDWMVLDVGSQANLAGVVGYLHGTCVPTMRLMRVASEAHKPPDAAPNKEGTRRTWPREASLLCASSSNDLPEQPFSSLYAGVSVGYKKDIVRWADIDTLELELGKRLNSLTFGTRRISTLNEALDYFLEATRRKEPVFVSYAGEDEELSADFRSALRKRFQQVFDYRDGKSIPPGTPWITTIFDQINRSAVGIPLLSSNYVKSGNCLHELRDIVALADQHKLSLMPVKLRRGDDFELPSEMKSTQYARQWEYDPVQKLVDWIVENLPRSPAASATR